MTFAFLPAATRELDQVIDHYEAAQAGLGAAFFTEVQHTIRRILDHPYAWQKMSRRARRCRTRRFPYGLVYHVEGNHATIIAVMHLKRRPGYWKDRLR